MYEHRSKRKAEVLNIPKTATKAEVKKAYHKVLTGH
jgi:DnaJ-class molecular chaperone